MDELEALERQVKRLQKRIDSLEEVWSYVQGLSERLQKLESAMQQAKSKYT